MGTLLQVDDMAAAAFLSHHPYFLIPNRMGAVQSCCHAPIDFRLTKQKQRVFDLLGSIERVSLFMYLKHSKPGINFKKRKSTAKGDRGGGVYRKEGRVC